MKFNFFISFIAFSLLSQIFYGQSSNIDIKNLKLKHISLEQGLSQSSVLSILQDKNGFLWFGTRDGLNKYDGHNFKTYKHISNDSTSLSNNYIKALYEDDHGNMWIGTSNGLNLYVESEDNFQRFMQTNNISNNEISNIIKDDSDHLWVATYHQLKSFSIKEKRIIDNRGIKLDTPIRAILKSEDGKLWIKTTTAVGTYDFNNKTLKRHTLNAKGINDLNLNIISCLYEDRSKNIWLGYKNGLALLNKESNTFEVYSINKNQKSSINDNVRSIHEDYHGNLWIGTYNGLYILNANKTSIEHFQHNEDNNSSLSQNSVFKIFEDSKGDIWIGTYAGGINYYDRNYDSFKLFSPGGKNTLNYKVVSSIVEDGRDNLWIGTEGGGLNYYNDTTGNFEYFIHNPKNKNSLSSNNVKAITKDVKGNLWVGTFDGGLNFINIQNNKKNFQHFKNIPNDTTSISNDRVTALCEDDNNNIWLGTRGGGVNIINKDSKRVTRLKPHSKYSKDFVNVITKSLNTNILYIGGNEGLYEIDIYTQKINPINFRSDDNVFTKTPVISIYEDNTQNLWIGTEGNGLYYYDKKTKISSNYGIAEGLPSEIIYGILAHENNLWLSTNQGLSKFDLTTKKVKNFDASDGIQGNEFNYGAYLKTKNNKLFFGGANGLTIFNPDDITGNSFIPPVLVTDIRINNELHYPKYTKTLKLNHKQNVFSFNFVALSYSKPTKNQYAYKLEGFDKDWIYIGNRRSTTYTNIDPGKYTFRVKASNSDDLWNGKGDEVFIEIFPAPWKSWWAYLLYMLVLSGIAFLIRKYYLQRLTERKELIREREEKEKIKEINALKLQLFTNISHDFRTPLTLIVAPLEKMIEDHKNITLASIQKQHTVMHRNAMILLQQINQFLDFRKNESGQFKLEASKSNIITFIDDIKKSFDELAVEKNINFKLKTTEDNIEVWFDKIKLRKIIYNLLSNAFKNTPNDGDIIINISTTEKFFKDDKITAGVKIKICDTGIGISKENLKFIFERFYNLDKKHGGSLGTGIGLSLTKSLVSLHKGYIDVKSEIGKGTCFTVLLPLGNSHLSKQEIIKKDSTNTMDYGVYNKPFELLEKRDTQNEANIVDSDESLPTILIVEDNTDVRDLLKSIFINSFNILEAKNGKVGLELANNHTIDVVISDIMMPFMDGIELCETIKTNINTSHIPVVLLTAKTSKESEKSGYETGADLYIAKPFNPNLLFTQVNNIILSRKSLIEKFRKDIIIEPKAIAATSADELFLEKVFNVVMENLSNPDFSVYNLADMLNMSRSILYKKIKALTGQSIYDFIKTIKLKHAGQLLVSRKDLNISQIAYEIGFVDLKHFRKLFKNLFNELPSEYRNNPKNYEDKEPKEK
ncbi:hybrid sensor histidine kinase/response regulator transcription factor [Algibacter mikhailovii]|uniref:histidine kinase n=1 Tax=Algibacter mikhailovii TaxID=425498 RepID=A0A918R282_9FLAO|nr:two-component regulator propeller domain-containing protein [Algibacter mikhailovii]GGZ81777.1 hybrid sensor histidine kinase/response regulator [Algibacter mikhailovii]